MPMAMTPTAVVTAVLDITDDPKDPANIIVTLSVRFLFMGPVTLEQQISVSSLNTLTDAERRAANNAAIIAAAAALGYVLDASRILTTTDMVGNW
jgi:hypothetical protein